MDRESLKKIMPHREPMLLLDECSKEGEDSSVGTYRVKGDEFFLQGHFPGNPIVPGVIQLEMMAQACAVIIAGEGDGSSQPLFTGVSRAKFKGIVRPGDLLTIRSRITKIRKPFYFAESEISVEDRTVSQAEVSFALMPSGVPGR